jgi:hypothetical protein
MTPASRIITAAATALLVAACCVKTTAPDPVAEEIGRVVRAETRIPVHIESATKLDSTSIATELTRRRGIQELKIYQDSCFRQKYLSQGMIINARRKAGAIEKSRKIITGLDSIRQRLGADTAHIAYYDYEFEFCMADANGDKTAPKKAYATVTPDGHVVTWSQDRRDIHKASGLAIPGYRELLDKLRDSE